MMYNLYILQEIGAQPPLGFWDPLGLLKDADQERFDRLRKVEVKHGRVAMLAVLGHIVTTAGARANGEIAFGVPFSSVKSGLAALDTIPAGLFRISFFDYFNVMRSFVYSWNRANHRLHWIT